MKFITLLTAAYVGGSLRHPHEGVLHVEDVEAEELIRSSTAADVSGDFTAKQDKASPVETITAPGGAEAAPASEHPHQAEVAPQAAETEAKPRRKAPADKE